MKKQIPLILLPFLQNNITKYFPEQFPESPNIEILNVSGFTGNFFKITSVKGERFFLKARSLDDDEYASNTEVLNYGKAVKEAMCMVACENIGVSVPQIYPLALIPKDELPETLANLFTRSVKGRERPFVLNLQNLVDGNEGYIDFDNSALQELIFKNLGYQVAKINSIKVNGFGACYNKESNSFTQNWQERIEMMELDNKIKSLEKHQILNTKEVSTIFKILESIKTFKADSVLIHTDVNPGNYKYRSDGTISAILDWEDAEGGPWQYELAIQMGRIESGTFRMTAKDRTQRLNAFINGYGRSTEELNDNRSIINCFRTIDAINRLYIYYVKVGSVPFVKDAYLMQENDTYISTKQADESDYVYSALGRESVIKRLIAEMIHILIH